MHKSNLILALAFASSFAVSAAARPVVVGLADASGKSKTNDHSSLVRHLTSGGMPVEVKFFPSYDALYDAFKKNQVDLAGIGPVKYVQARFETGAVPIVRDNSQTVSAVVVRADSPIKTVEQLKGKTFGFGYRESTSTHLMPLLVLSKHHIKENDLAKVEFVGAEQQDVVNAILSGRVHAGGVAVNVYEANKDKLRLLDLSEGLPGAPIVMHKNVDAKTASSITNLFLSFKPTAEERKQRYGNGFVKTSDAEYNKIRFLCAVVLKKKYVK